MKLYFNKLKNVNRHIAINNYRGLCACRNYSILLQFNKHKAVVYIISINENPVEKMSRRVGYTKLLESKILCL